MTDLCIKIIVALLRFLGICVVSGREWRNHLESEGLSLAPYYYTHAPPGSLPGDDNYDPDKAQALDLPAELIEEIEGIRQRCIAKEWESKPCH
jgi:hypothetical protein